MNLLSQRDRYRDAIPYSAPDRVEARANDLLAEHQDDVRALRQAAAAFLAQISRRRFPLGEPIPGYEIADLRAFVLAATKAGECDPGDWEQEAWDRARDQEEWS